MESLILAQNERWQRGLGMQVERDAVPSIFGEMEQLRVAEGRVTRGQAALKSGTTPGNRGIRSGSLVL